MADLLLDENVLEPKVSAGAISGNTILTNDNQHI